MDFGRIAVDWTEQWTTEQVLEFYVIRMKTFIFRG